MKKYLSEQKKFKIPGCNTDLGGRIQISSKSRGRVNYL